MPVNSREQFVDICNRLTGTSNQATIVNALIELLYYSEMADVATAFVRGINSTGLLATTALSPALVTLVTTTAINNPLHDSHARH